MAHARAKFKYALGQGNDKDVAFILKLIGELYKLEREYEEGKLSSGQIRLCRNNLKIKAIIIKLRSKLDVLLSDDHPLRGDLMEKGISYMNTLGTQLFAYLNGGSCSIDNSIAERFIHPLAGERKNSLFFGSDRMTHVSIPSSPLARCRGCQCWIISRDSSVKLLKDVGIMNICCP